MQGNYGSDFFDYFKIDLYACDPAEIEDCFGDEELYDINFNFIMIKAYPNILDDNRENIVVYQQDSTQYYFIDPWHR